MSDDYQKCRGCGAPLPEGEAWRTRTEPACSCECAQRVEAERAGEFEEPSDQWRSRLRVPQFPQFGVSSIMGAIPDDQRETADERPTTKRERLIRAECDHIADLLCAKNRAYGDSALNPLRVFSRASTEEQILVRIDDKLSRVKRGGAAGEDVVLDLIGYLVLLRMAREER